MILLKVALNAKNQLINQIRCEFFTEIRWFFLIFLKGETFPILFYKLAYKMLYFVKHSLF